MSAALRSAEEIAAFEGKLVRVVAAHTEDHCLGWGNGAQAAIVGRCVRGIVEFLWCTTTPGLGGTDLTAGVQNERASRVQIASATLTQRTEAA